MPSLGAVPQGPSTYHASSTSLWEHYCSQALPYTLLFVGFAIKMNYSQLATAMQGPLLFSSEIQWQFHS
jgi:hypothetical protein